MCVAFGVVSHCLYVVPGKYGGVGPVYVVVVDPQWALSKGDWSRVAMDHIVQHGVVCHTVECLRVPEGEDVGSAVGVIPYPATAPVKQTNQQKIIKISTTSIW